MTNPEIDQYGTQRWRKSEIKLHRTDGPAVIYVDGSQSWYVNNKLHRTDGPAITYVCCGHVDQEWWVNGKWRQSNKEYQEAAKISDEEMMLIVLKYGNVE